ncbi:glycosyltransferase [Prochlorococcus marinus]|uniref:glycosyltransferase n=1 Tax=Prochlorococcus marinus TaxID=1219 RepID=UPI0001900590|nr:glycosyltransferase [Prochlorococcus marinus]EEE39752.1 glycosyl transferase, group 1 [Prochlorococcus marinus str. MIT 9202]
MAFICTSLDNVAGGLERQLVRVASQMYEIGFEVIIISYDNEPSYSFYEIPTNLKWIKCGNGLVPHSSASLVERLKQIYKLRKILISCRITHLITFHHGLFPRSFLASIFLPIVKIVSERNSLQNYTYIKLKKLNLGFLSLFLADLITIQLDNYKNQYPFILRGRIKVVPNLLSKNDKYIEPEIDSYIVSLMGRLCPQKNFNPLLDQCLENIDLSKNLKIRIAGEGEYRELFEKKYKKLISLGILELMGNIQNTESFLRSSALFCLPSLWEGYPNSLVEALGFGLPIILTSRLRNLSDFVVDEYNGIFVDDKNYLNTIIEMINDKNRLRSMSKNSFTKYKLLREKSSIKNWINLIN